MTKEIEKIIARFKIEVGKSKQMTSREMKLIEICYDELVVKNCNKPPVSQQSELLKEIFDLTAGAWDDPVISEDLYNRMEAAISFNCG